MSFRIEFEIPGTPKATNAILGRSYWVKHKNAVAWKRSVAAVTVGQKPALPLTWAKLILTRYNYRMLDYDGLVASFKPVVDGLVECGVLKNDTWKITGTWDVRQEYTPKGTDRIRVIVYERKEAEAA